MILIVGGAGYIGSHVNKLLNQKNYKSIVFDNLIYGHKESVKWGEFVLGDTNNLDRIREIDTLTNVHIKTIYPTPAALAEKVQRSEVVVGAVLVPGAKAPKIVSRDMVKDMMPGGVIIDVAIDQGGCVEDIRPTSHQTPTYIQDDVIHYAVTNMPGIVGHTASISLSNATLPYVRSIAKNGVPKAVTLDSSLAKGVNTIGGQITYPALAESLSMAFSNLEEMLS